MAQEIQSPAPALTVSELHAAAGRLIEQGAGDCVIAVPYQPGRVTMGASPSMPLIGITAGFDWDNGTVFLQPRHPLGAGSDALQKQARDYDSLAGRIYRANRLIAKCGEDISGPALAELKLILGAK